MLNGYRERHRGGKTVPEVRKTSNTLKALEKKGIASEVEEKKKSHLEEKSMLNDHEAARIAKGVHQSGTERGRNTTGEKEESGKN